MNQRGCAFLGWWFCWCFVQIYFVVVCVFNGPDAHERRRPVEGNQIYPMLRCRLLVAKSNATIGPVPQSMAINPKISTSGRVADVREGIRALVTKPGPSETLDLVATVTSVI